MATILLDIETTGLDPHVHGILEIYAKVFDDHADRTFHAIIKPENFVWTPFCLDLHIRNGLLPLCLTEGISSRQAMDDFYCWLLSISTGLHTAVGKGVGRFDLPFLYHVMPSLKERFHHNTVDVGSLYWRPDTPVKSLAELAKQYGFQAQTHRAAGDVDLCNKLLRLWCEQLEDAKHAV